MEYNHRANEPLLTPIKSGWAAHGDGWAVHGRTREEAIEKFREAERRHQEIDSRPLWFERCDIQSMHESNHV
jgi:hypothetical protein